MISGSLRSEARMNCKDNFLTEPQTKPQTHKQTKKSSSSDGASCQCVCMCHCLDVKYHSRCCKQCVRSVVCNVLEVQNKTKQKCNLFCRRHTLRGAQYKTQHNGTERGWKLSQDTNWNINNKTCTTAKMHCRCQELGKNDCALGNESDPVESLFLWIFPPEERKTHNKTFLCRSRDLFPGHIWWSTPLFLILNPQAVLSRSAYKPNNLKTFPPYYCVALSDVQMTLRINISQMFILNNRQQTEEGKWNITPPRYKWASIRHERREEREKKNKNKIS